jgi:hypothetical protein
VAAGRVDRDGVVFVNASQSDEAGLGLVDRWSNWSGKPQL